LAQGLRRQTGLWAGSLIPPKAVTKVRSHWHFVGWNFFM
jgi:hypothetical protein